MIDAERCASSLNERSDYTKSSLANITMASKITYWKCVDCNSMINDENIHDLDGDYAEFCYGCMNYNPEVVIAYQ